MSSKYVGRTFVVHGTQYVVDSYNLVEQLYVLRYTSNDSDWSVEITVASVKRLLEKYQPLNRRIYEGDEEYV